MSKKTQFILLGILVFLILLLVGLNFALSRYGAFWREERLSLKFLKERLFKETLVGKDFIALPEKKILELLSLPENKEKMILPAYPSPETRLTVEPYKDKYGEHKMILISGLDERTLFNPTVEGVRFSTIIQGSGGSDNITYSSALFFLKGNGFIIEVDNQPEVEFNAIKPEEEDDITFGTILASNIQKRTLPRYGENDLCVFCSSEPVGDNPMEYLLRYKGKIVARFSSVLITSKNSTSTVG